MGLPIADWLQQALALACRDASECARVCRDLRVLWNPRLQSTLGRAIAHHTIELNVRLAGDYCDHARDTFWHEIAHILVAARAPKGRRRPRPHGVEWAEIMRRMALAPTPCYRPDPARPPVSRRRSTRRFLYDCPRCGEKYHFGPLRHRRASRRPTRWFYLCRRCDTALRFAGPVSA